MNRRELLRAFALAPLLIPQLSRAFTPDGSRNLTTSFGTLPAPQTVRRVFTAGANAAVLVYALAPEKLLGWPLELNDEARHLLPRTRHDLPRTGRLSGRGSTVGIESLLALRPDLVLDSGTVDPTYLSSAERVYQQTGLPYALVEGRFPDHPAQLREVGRLLGVQARGNALAGEAQQIIDLVHTVLEKVPRDARPRVYYGRDPDGLKTGRRGSINVEVIDFVGGTNVAAQAGDGGLSQVSMEQILVWNPEIVLTQDPHFARHAMQDPLWRSVSAVRAKQVYLLPSVPFGWIDGPPSINRLIGAHWLLSKFYPGQHPELAPARVRQAVIDFYQSIYGSTPPAYMLDGLSGAAA